MNVLFLTIGRFESIEMRGLYPDLLREFRNHGHKVYVVCANERRNNRKTEIIDDNNAKILRVKIGNLTKVNLIEKGVSTLTIDYKYRNAIRRYWENVSFDLILYSTPPITLANTINHLKKKKKAYTYLLLKDIFPQNAVDIGILNKHGLKGLIYTYFRKKEKKLYAISDRIGCMSNANIEYLVKHNQELDRKSIGVCPNSIEPMAITLSEIEKRNIREKYNLPYDKKIFVYGGNLGKPQGISHLIECLQSQINETDRFFLIVGDGTDFSKIEAFICEKKPKNIALIRQLPKEEYDYMIAACDVGLLFLDPRFTIPNFPSRLLSYMQAGLPVLACTDVNTDVGQVIQEGDFGWWCKSNDTEAFKIHVQNIASQDTSVMGFNARKYLIENYHVKDAYKSIIDDINLGHETKC